MRSILARTALVSFVTAVLTTATFGIVGATDDPGFFIDESAAARALLLINEVNYDPLGEDNNKEWVELINMGDDWAPLEQYTLKPDVGYYVDLTEGGTVPPGGKVVVRTQSGQVIRCYETPTAGKSEKDQAVAFWTDESSIFRGTATPTPPTNDPMGNDHGFVALFRGPIDWDGLVDFVQWGAPGESLPHEWAITADRWQDGDYTLAVWEGYTLGRYYQNLDYDNSGDWVPYLSSECNNNGIGQKAVINVNMNQKIYEAGDTCILSLMLRNPGPTDTVDEFLILDVFGEYWFWPSFEQDLDFRTKTIPQGFEEFETVLEFVWPSGAGAADGIIFWAACLDSGTTNLECWDMVSFGFR